MQTTTISAYFCAFMASLTKLKLSAAAARLLLLAPPGPMKLNPLVPITIVVVAVVYMS